MDTDGQGAWQDLLIEHSQFPRGHAELPAPTHLGNGDNPLCGDRVRVQLVVDAEGRIAQAACQSVGCAISIASASLLADSVKGLRLAEAERLFDTVHGLLTRADAGPAAALGDLRALRAVRRYPSRVKCAALAWHALRLALSGGAGPATTE